MLDLQQKSLDVVLDYLFRSLEFLLDGKHKLVHRGSDSSEDFAADAAAVAAVAAVGHR